MASIVLTGNFPLVGGVWYVCMPSIATVSYSQCSRLTFTQQLLAYADDVNILGGGIRTLKENDETLVDATREIGLEVSADKTKFMVMCRDQNAGQNHSVRIDNNTFERVEEFKYLGKTLTNKNSIAEEIKNRLRSGNACYHSVQNLLSSRLLYKNLKIKIYRTKILPVFFCMGVKFDR